MEKDDLTKDRLTGLFDRNGFTIWLERHNQEFGETQKGNFMIVYFDVQRFKVVNDLFGWEEGNRLLQHIGEAVKGAVGEDGAGCRIDSDRFVLVLKCLPEQRDSRVKTLLDEVSAFDLPFEIICNAGIYIIRNDHHSPDSLIDRAIMAQSTIRGSYTESFCYYTEKLRENLLTEQEIIGMTRAGIQNEQFQIYYQPQYNHSTHMLVGAEALVRWLHPEKGLISPGTFIPVFEKNGFITKLDLYVFEKTCRFLRKRLDSKQTVVPISVNLSRYDIFTPNFIEKLEETRKKYGIPHQYIRVEITESVAFGNSKFINEALKKLHGYDYVVEMDDFGSGYSSLNILKDVDFDIIKLDMKFLDSEAGKAGKGGIILSSIVHMVNWLGLPIIAEGVETASQADFLKSIGCDYIQGYLYSRPLSEKDFEEHISREALGTTAPQMKLIDTLNAADFWSDDSLETLIFNNFVGGASIVDYKGGKPEILRVNQKYLAELGMNLTEKEVIDTNPLDYMEEEDRKAYINMLERAIETEEEQECETWCIVRSRSCGDEKLCLRTSARMIGKSKGNYLFYVMIRNITSEKNQIADILDNERRFKAVSEQENIYYWEYTIATKEMRPCYRCRRDLGLPALLTNYPDCVIEQGFVAPEWEETYRDWHRQMEEGVEKFEAVIPLTKARIPFKVKYTTKFDENNRPIKAYGSATLANR